MRLARILGIVALLLLAPALAGAGEGFLVVAHPSVKVEALGKDQLSRVFLRKQTRWPGGQEIRPVEPRPESAARRAFTAWVHGKTVEAVRSYWQQMIFSGRDVPPAEKGTDEQIVAYVREHPGAIGYVSESADTAGLKVVPLGR